MYTSVLSRRNLAATGEVLFNNCNLGIKDVKKFACFIMQEDIFYGFITVKQHLQAMVLPRLVILTKLTCLLHAAVVLPLLVAPAQFKV